MAKDLIIVESPAKVKTIKKFLGNKYVVQASVGHVRDLPTSVIGVDEDNDFAPQYKVIEGKQKVVDALSEAAAKANIVYLAPDPDREGEAIAWHVAELIKAKNSNVKRIQFNEITAKAVREALDNPRELNKSLFDAQQARRVLDRLVGYKLSPLLWKKVKRGISAGRVQSVALRLIVDREHERHAFEAEEYWLFRAQLAKMAPQNLTGQKAADPSYPAFKVELNKVDGKKPVIPNAETANALDDAMKGQPFIIAAVEAKKRDRQPQPPFITSTLQQSANQRLGYTAKRTMNIAQRLYEGVDLGDMGTLALITYMRTDSVRISDEARQSTHDFILSTWGQDYYPEKPRFFKTKGSAQDAHEAIRPVDVNVTPDSIKHLLPPDQYQLYRLIWSRFVASQMAAARFHDTTVTITCGPAEWRAKGERILFAGFLTVMPQREDTTELPPLEAGEELFPISVEKEQKFTQPPARYTEASLVRDLEERGIGRPSTYAAIISTLIDRDYTHLVDKHFIPTDLGSVVCDLLARHFTTLMDVGFTAGMEDSLDQVAEGKLNWVHLLGDFSAGFNPTLEQASKAMETVKGGLSTDILCEQCQKPMVIKFGKAGPFLACTGYPDCRNTKNFSRDDKGNVVVEERSIEAQEKVGVCPDCGSDLVIKKARTGSRFIACTGYPECRHIEAFSTGMPCPREGCHGQIVEKSSKRGKIFYSCDQFPSCDYALWDWPVQGPCPQCGAPYLTLKKASRSKGPHIACPEKTCRYKRDLDRKSVV